jgi:1,2-diacylglycerol-3-alpha-glucose alpha-1,2-glucosyltransferase
LQGLEAKRRGIPVVYYAHSTEEDFKDSFLLSNQTAKTFKWWLKRCYGLGDLILTPTAYSKKIIESYDLNLPIKQVSNGIDLSYWQASPSEIADFKQTYSIHDDMPTIISVGLQIKRKGIIEFVEMAKRMPEVQFIWFGESNPHIVGKEVRDAINTTLPNLTFAGYIARDKIRLAYQSADLYVFLTHEETEGIVLLEALASKTPTLVSDLPVFDYLTNKVNVYKARGINEYINVAKNILSGIWPNLSENGYKIAQERSIEAIGEQYKIYYQLAFDLAQKNKER